MTWHRILNICTSRFLCHVTINTNDVSVHHRIDALCMVQWITEIPLCLSMRHVLSFWICSKFVKYLNVIDHIIVKVPKFPLCSKIGPGVHNFSLTCFYSSKRSFIYVCIDLSTRLYKSHGPLARYLKLRVAHAPGTFLTHVPWCRPGSLTSGLLWSRWQGKRSWHSRRRHNPHFYVSGKRPMSVKTWFSGPSWNLWFSCFFYRIHENVYS